MRLVAREQTAKDADATAKEQETGGEQQQRRAGDGISDLSYLAKDSSSDLTKRSDQSSHSISNLQNHPLQKMCIFTLQERKQNNGCGSWI